MVVVAPLVMFLGACSEPQQCDPGPCESDNADAGIIGGTDGGNNGTDGGDNQQNTNPRLQPPEDLKANPEPLATDVGFELGDAVTKTIGSAGGTVSFGSEGPTIEIPAGALAADTEISIQRIANRAPHKLGHAFRFGPEGTQFSSKVKVTFPLPSEAVDSDAVEGIGVAFQDGDGFWQALADVTVDKGGGTVAGETDHFSDWTLFQQYELRPGVSSVEVNKSLGLWVYRCVGDFDPVTLIAPLLPSCKAAPGFSNWTVNGIASGNASVGTTDPLAFGAAYSAPAKKPSPNPVAIAVEVPMGGTRKGLLVASVRVFDDVCSFEKPCVWSGVSQWEQTSTNVSGQAQVRWIVDSKDEDNKRVTYRPEGSVWYRDEETGCVPQDLPLSLSAHNGSRDTKLVLDYSEATPKFWLNDSVADWDTTLVCPDGSTDPDIEWGSYVAEGAIASFGEDGTTMSGSTVDEEIGLYASYRFTRE